jgi:molecular chaperone GrpE (heat shock protein)
MSQTHFPRLIKWPFLLGDLLLIGFAVYLLNRGTTPITTGQALVSLLAVLAGALLCIFPFLWDFRTLGRVQEAETLAGAVAQLGHLREVHSAIVSAAGQLTAAQQSSTQTVSAARELSDRMKAELAQFCDFLKKANDTEKGTLKLEVEKLRRTEAEWLQSMVHILDHVFALHKAASRSGQPGLAAQLDRFQLACREIVRRLGLAAFTPTVPESFNPELHQTTEAAAEPVDHARIIEVLALGFTYQGKLVRRALVQVENAPAQELSGAGVGATSGTI